MSSSSNLSCVMRVIFNLFKIFTISFIFIHTKSFFTYMTCAFCKHCPTRRLMPGIFFCVRFLGILFTRLFFFLVNILNQAKMQMEPLVIFLQDYVLIFFQTTLAYLYNSHCNYYIFLHVI